MNSHMKRKVRKILSPIRRIGLKNKNFSIISNNCWGGIIYDIFGLQYKSPTIGCFILPKHYIKMINNLHYYMNIDCKKILFGNSSFQYDENLKNVPIGIIDDVEICFLHYSSIEEAIDKWNRRKKRINWDNLLIKFSDQNGFSIEDYYEFKKIKSKKIFITANNELRKENDIIFIDKFESLGYAKDDIKPSFKLINLKKILNGLED